jgi:hypothetical protein
MKARRGSPKPGPASRDHRAVTTHAGCCRFVRAARRGVRHARIIGVVEDYGFKETDIGGDDPDPQAGFDDETAMLDEVEPVPGIRERDAAEAESEAESESESEAAEPG